MSDSDVFIVEGYEYLDGLFEATFAISDGSTTTTLIERVDFRAVEQLVAPQPALLRLLTLACSLSYYKASAATRIEVSFGLDDAERTFFAQLIRGGLSEFAFRNDLPGKLVPTIIAAERPLAGAPIASDWQVGGRPLIAVGGGKDSVVTIETVKAEGMNPLLFSVNRFDPIDRCVTVSGCDYVAVFRTLDPQLHVLNAQGATNGHVPVTAINSIIGLLIADIAQLGSLVMSNEKSASSGNLTWGDFDVNHQWSKGQEFEDLLRFTLTAEGLDHDRYFSLLRSLREIDIAKKFATLPQYFPVFTSCNRVFTIDPESRNTSWCCECPKCLFVFLILAPFIGKSELVTIFGSNLLEQPTNKNLYEEILGIRGNKPFECVGEFDEAAEAFRLLALMPEWRSTAIVTALAGSIPEAPVSNAEPAASRVPYRFEAAERAAR